MPFWPFRRRSRSGADDEAPPALPAEEGAPVPGPDRSDTGPQRLPETTPATPVHPSGEWRHLPPLRPTAGAFPLTAPVQRIREGLAVDRTPDLSLAPLGHLRGDSGPIGVVNGVLQPTAGTHPVERAASDGLDVARRPAPPPADVPAVVPLRRPVVQRAPEGAPAAGPAPSRGVPPAVAPPGDLPAAEPAPSGAPPALAPSADLPFGDGAAAVGPLPGGAPLAPPAVVASEPAPAPPAAATEPAGPAPVATPPPPADLPAVPVRVVPAVAPGVSPLAQRAPDTVPVAAAPATGPLPVAVQRHDLHGSEPVAPDEAAAEPVQRAPEASAAMAPPPDAPLVGATPLVAPASQPPERGDAVPPGAVPEPGQPAMPPAVTPGAAGVQRLPDTGPPVPLAGRTVTRRRLGEPLHERPESMVRPGELPVASPPAAQRAAEGAPAAAPGAAPVPPVPARPVARRVPAVPDDEAVDLPTTGAAPPAMPPGAPVAALVGNRPLHPVQRLAEAETASAEPGGAAPSPAALPSILTAVAPPGPGEAPPVPVRRTPSASSERVPGPPPPAPGGGAAPAGVQRAPEGVPAELRRTLEPALGADFSRTPVHRGADTDAAAGELQAKAFAVGGEVHLPARHGPTDGGEGQAILAHELTHIAQQQRLGSSLPHEDSPEGQRLETEAREVAGAVSQPQRLPEQPLTHLTVPAASAPTAGAQRLPAAPPLPPGQAVAVAQQVQRAALESGIGRPTGDGGIGVAFAAPATGAGDDGGPVFLGSPQRLPEVPGSPVPGVQRAVEIPELTSSVSAEQRPASGTPDFESWQPDDIELLLDKVFPRLRLRLRTELLVQRERAGTLQDLR